LRRKLAQQIEREKEEERRAKEAAAVLARRNRSKSQREIKEKLALFAEATALTVSQGCKDPSFSDLREGSGVPRLV
jgi:hypothetical protein